MTKNISNNFSENVVGIIAEYNPFHNGHAFHIQQAKKLCNAPFCIVVMSGDFVQRGAPAVFDKYARTFMALSSGADLVIELPPCFALSSAENFASCAIALLDHLGVASHVCFGSECGDVSALMDLARILVQEPEELSQSIRNYTSSGLSYPMAREKALTHYLSSCRISETPASLLSSPNNTLGIEYLKALLRTHSPMIPTTVLRKGSGYHDQELLGNFASATAIRSAVFNMYEKKAAGHRDCAGYNQADTLCRETYDALTRCVPPACLNIINTAVPVTVNDFSLLLSYRLLELSSQAEGAEIFADVSRDLALRIKKQTLDFSSFEERISALKTRQYTYTRISRCLMHILLHMTHNDMQIRSGLGYASYIRILGFCRKAAPLLSAIKKASALPLITKTADAPRILSSDALRQFNQDLFCSHIYQSAVEQKSHVKPENEYTRSVVIV